MSESTDVQTAIEQVQRLSETLDENADASEDFDELRQFLANVEDALAVASEH
ncbi:MULTISPECIES: hypothetical protein [Halorussus]|uniref:hypothetical protein n=1 Tax=Halorussus TaxID=1070314 RepID=UPI00209CCFBC|nr:hypothetical protein [Halorussus vallis]USZ74465.1 hypothetical protein NGM07_13540 [Halorussus vallis]